MTTSSRDPYRPTITTVADVTALWRTIINPLGWHRRRLYLTFIDADGRANPQLVEIDGVPEDFGPVDAERVVQLLSHVLGESDPTARASVAVMLARPGRTPVTDDDRSLCRLLHAAARAADLHLQVLHVGSDDAIVPVPMDEALPRTA